MLERPGASLAEPPAPRIERKPVRVTQEEVVRMAKLSVVADFTRQMAYDERQRELLKMGGNVSQVINPMDGSDYVRAQTVRYIKEQRSAHWAATIRAISLNTLFAVTGVTTAVFLYLGIRHRPILLAVVPFSGAATVQGWMLLEIAWENERFAKQASMVRARRIGNPQHAVTSKTRRIIEDDSLMM